jgi:hypothetical protein
MTGISEKSARANFGPSVGVLTDGLSKTVGIRKDLIAGAGRWVMVFCPLSFGTGPYADGVPQQDFPVKVASRSTPWAQAGNAP